MNIASKSLDSSQRAAGNTPDGISARANSRPNSHPRQPDCPSLKPSDPRFSSGPCRKHPGWSLEAFDTSNLGCSHRAKEPKARLKTAIERSAELIGLPAGWKLGILPGSDTGAFEAALWSLLGTRPVDVLVWESFSADWASDLSSLGLDLTVHRADYGQLPALAKINNASDIVFVYNGTTSGVRVPDLDWIPETRDGLVLCDATSAAFAMHLDFERLDVVTWSWQKVLGGEAAHGMLALSPKAIERLESTKPLFPLPKIFRLTKNGKLIDGIFSGATINTPSMLAVEDLHSALDWSMAIGGLDGLIQRTSDNFAVVNQWVMTTPWIDWLAVKEASRSQTSMCLKIIDPAFTSLTEDEQKTRIAAITDLLRAETVAFDIGAYRTAPPGFRLWGGPTIDTSEFTKLTPWLDWAYQYVMTKQN